MWRRLPICLTVCMGWSPWHTVTGMTRTPSFRKCPTEGRRLSEVVACEVCVLPSSPWRPVRPACCLRLWPWTFCRLFDVPHVLCCTGSDSITSFASSCASSKGPTVAFFLHLLSTALVSLQAVLRMIRPAGSSGSQGIGVGLGRWRWGSEGCGASKRIRLGMGMAMSAMPMLFWKGNFLHPPPPFRINAQPATHAPVHSASQPTPNYWTRNLPWERLLTPCLVPLRPSSPTSDSDCISDSHFGEWPFLDD